MYLILKKYLSVLKNMLVMSVLILSSVLRGNVLTDFQLPAAVHPDTEVMRTAVLTNFQAAGVFAVDLVCQATPSNNVEIAFGCDDNADGALDANEVGCVLAWDCGSWRTRIGDDAWIVDSTSSVCRSGRHELSWQVAVGHSGNVRSFAATVDEVSVFTALSEAPPRGLYSRAWNRVRVTARGIDEALADLSISTSPDGLSIYVR